MNTVLKQLSQNRYAPVAGILVAVLVVYSQTLQIPWYLDDIPAIVENSALRDLGVRLAGFFAPRGPVDLSFALNFRLHGLQLAGYHTVNITLHLANGILFYLLLKRIFRDNPLPQYAALAIFLLHPVQTQAVNYVVQRYTLAAAFCGLLSLFLITLWGEDRGFPFGSSRAVFTYLAALFIGALSVMCKQNMAPLFLAITMCCAMFIERKWSKRDLACYLALPFMLVPLWELVRQVVIPMVSGSSLTDISGLFASSGTTSQVSPTLYGVTQLKVVWLYIRLLVLPYGQALDYGYPLATTVFSIGNLAPLAGLCALLTVAWTVRYSSPRTSFGIAWFFIFLLVESTFIPLDPVFEHRLYLPLAGFAIVAADQLSKLPSKKLTCWVIVAASLLLGALTLQRNALWLSPSALLTDNVKKYPENARVYAGAANALISEGNSYKALELLQQGFRRGLKHEAMYISLITILISGGNLPEAVRVAEEGLSKYPGEVNIMYIAGLAEDLQGNHFSAERHFTRAISLYPWKEDGYNNLGTSLEKQGRLEEAAAAYRKALEINPLYSIGHHNLGSVLYKLKRPADAAKEFAVSYRLGGAVEALFSRAVAEAESGDRTAAETSLKELDSVDPVMGRALRAQLKR